MSLTTYMNSYLLSYLTTTYGIKSVIYNQLPFYIIFCGNLGSQFCKLENDHTYDPNLNNRCINLIKHILI